MVVVVVVVDIPVLFLLISTKFVSRLWHKLQFTDKQIAKEAVYTHAYTANYAACVCACVCLAINFYDQFVFCVETIYLAKRN